MTFACRHVIAYAISVCGRRWGPHSRPDSACLWVQPGPTPAFLGYTICLPNAH